MSRQSSSISTGTTYWCHGCLKAFSMNLESHFWPECPSCNGQFIEEISSPSLSSPLPGSSNNNNTNSSSSSPPLPPPPSSSSSWWQSGGQQNQVLRLVAAVFAVISQLHGMWSGNRENSMWSWSRSLMGLLLNEVVDQLASRLFSYCASATSPMAALLVLIFLLLVAPQSVFLYFVSLLLCVSVVLFLRTF